MEEGSIGFYKLFLEGDFGNNRWDYNQKRLKKNFK